MGLLDKVFKKKDKRDLLLEEAKKLEKKLISEKIKKDEYDKKRQEIENALKNLDLKEGLKKIDEHIVQLTHKAPGFLNSYRIVKLKKLLGTRKKELKAIQEAEKLKGKEKLGSKELKELLDGAYSELEKIEKEIKKLFVEQEKAVMKGALIEKEEEKEEKDFIEEIDDATDELLIQIPDDEEIEEKPLERKKKAREI